MSQNNENSDITLDVSEINIPEIEIPKADVNSVDEFPTDDSSVSNNDANELHTSEIGLDEETDDFSENSNIPEEFKVINFYDSNGNIKSERDFNADEIALRNAHIHNKLLTGTLSGIRNTKYGVVANISYGRFNIIIPASKMCIDTRNIINIIKSQLTRQLKRTPTETEIRRSSDVKIADILKRMLGAEIRFCIVGENGGVIAGNREIAEMRYLRWFYFSSRNPNIVNENSEVNATVTATYFDHIRVNINGCEKKLVASDLMATGEYDLRNLYYVGDTVKLIITKLDRSRVDTSSIDAFAKTYKKMIIEAKTREALETNVVELNKAYDIGTTSLATVKNIRKNGVYTLLLPNGAMVTGYPPTHMSKIAMPGDKIAVLITGISEDGKRLKCEIKRLVAKR